MHEVDIDTARRASGLRLVVLANVPSPWSAAAKAILACKGIDAMVVRMQFKDEAVRAWTGIQNAPVAMYNDEVPRSGWAEILGLAERLQPDPSLIPAEPAQRVLMHGLAHEIMGESGLLWCMRQHMVEASRSHRPGAFPTPVAEHLGDRYGHQSGRAGQAEQRMRQVLGLLDQQLTGIRGAGRYYFGPQLTALDLYSAAAMDTLAPLPPEQAPMPAIVRAAFEARYELLKDDLPPSLLAHRDMMHERHIPLPLHF